MSKESERDEILEEIRRVARLVGGDSLGMREFQRRGKIGVSAVLRKFETWNKAVEAAGLRPESARMRLADADLEAEFRRVAELVGRAPTRMEFAARARFSPGTYEKRFGNWGNALAHYLGAEAVSPLPRRRQGRQLVERSAPAGRQRIARPPIQAGRGSRVFGAPIDFRGLRHEPIDEQGVVFLFGMVAHELGFLVESVRTAFPDCRAKRLAKGGRYVELDIELESRSSKFREHGHKPEECDLVVCWEHDWPDCPVEVLELKSAIKELDPNV